MNHTVPYDMGYMLHTALSSVCFSFFFARISSLIRRLTSPRTQDGTLRGLHKAAERIQPAEQEQRPGEGGGVRGGVLARGEGGAGVLPLRKERCYWTGCGVRN